MDEKRQETIRELMDRAGLSEAEFESLRHYAEEIAEEIAAKISEYIAEFVNAAIEAWQKVAGMFTDIAGPLIEELQKILEAYSAVTDSVPPRAKRRRSNRERAQLIEQKYRAEIRRCEQQRIYRRIYKPSCSFR